MFKHVSTQAPLHYHTNAHEASADDQTEKGPVPPTL